MTGVFPSVVSTGSCTSFDDDKLAPVFFVVADVEEDDDCRSALLVLIWFLN